MEQLTRSESLLRRLLHDFGYNLPIESRLIFVNPEFYLYQAPLNLPIVFPTQLNRFINKFSNKSGELSGRHYQLTEKLVSLHNMNHSFTRVPPYSYDQLKKGIICGGCWHSFMNLYDKNTLVCKKCGSRENVHAAILRSVGELLMLFPDVKLTTNLIYEWCNIIPSKKTIRGVLKKNFKYTGHSMSSCYVKL